ncbi:MAG: hypothetical protein O2958_08665 [Gemmatimonadetes bacterium]|nr:hypothetical protein [Gemmatimonadota bacterium]MDA1104940.1 hypothetical protein [Gemmatimonadota bacterium]
MVRRSTLAALFAALGVTSLTPERLTAQAAPSSSDTPTVEERYASLSAADDYMGLVALWRENPDAAIPVIDRDLEGSLALWEAEGDAKGTEIEALLARAIRASNAALEATGRRRVTDYVHSFAGWNAEQRGSFRAGQRACRDGSGALREGDASRALERGRECRAHAEPLGDWWGTAMGLRVEGNAHLASDNKEEGALALARARLIFRELGLTSSALRIEADLASVFLELGQRARAETLIRDGKATAARLGLTDLEVAFGRLEEQLRNSPVRPPNPSEER